jgi:hypothetical protein
MMRSEKLLIFLCSKAIKEGDKKLSYRIASRLESVGIARIGTLRDLSKQHFNSTELQSKMIFINNCRAGCLKVLTNGFDDDRYLFFDVSQHLMVPEFDIDHYINTEIVSKINDKWP